MVIILGEGGVEDSSGGGGSATATAGGNTFSFDGDTYSIDTALPSQKLVTISNQQYNNGNFNELEGELEAGERASFADISVPPTKFILVNAISATAHPTVTYSFRIADPFDDGSGERIEQNLSGDAPWATPPEWFEPKPGGYIIAGTSASLILNNQDTNTRYNDVEGMMRAVVIDKKGRPTPDSGLEP